MRKGISEENYSSSLNEDIFVALFRKAAHEYLEEGLLDEVHDRTESKHHVYSPEFDKRMNRLIRRAIHKERMRRVRKTTLKIAMGFVIFLILSSVVVMSAEALRIKVFNFFIDIQEKATNIEIVDENESSSKENHVSEVLPSYIPEGYELSETEQFNNKRTSFYTNEEGKTIIIRQYDGEAKLGIDTEDADYDVIIINGQTAFYNIKDGLIMLIYKTDEHVFNVVGEISLVEAQNIAKSIK